MRTSFTIAIPTHDRRETLALAVRSALAQTRAPEQIIVLCDGCTDGSVETLRALDDERLEVLDLPKLPGFGYAHRNLALESARGEAIIWLADDDLLLPDHLERIGEYWDVGDADIVTAPAVLVHPDDGLVWMGEDWGVGRFRDDMTAVNTNVMASVSVRVALAKAVGGWDATVPRAADWELWRRCLAAGARAWSSAEPTVLHFRATGRVQAWPDRVRQNSEWFERIADRSSLRELRRELRRTQAFRDAARLAEHDAVAAGRAEAAGARDRLAAERDTLTAERDALRADCDALRTECHALRGERDVARGTLERIYGGGWWRLRARLLGLMGLLGRGDRAQRR